MFYMAETKIEEKKLKIVPFLNNRLIDMVQVETEEHEKSILNEMIMQDHPEVLNLGLKIGFPILI